MRTKLAALLAGLLWSACGVPPQENACDDNAQCEDQNPCTLDVCTQGICTNAPQAAVLPQDSLEDCLSQVCQDGAIIDAPNDNEVPPQKAPDDCTREICAGGVAFSIPNDGEIPAQTAAACFQRTCQAGEIVGDEVAGVCQNDQYCDADGGCFDRLRELTDPAETVTLRIEEPFANLTNFTGVAVANFNGFPGNDVAVSAPDLDTTATGSFREGAGEAYIVVAPSLPTHDVRSETRIHGAFEGDRAGLALAGCDFNGDGFDDLVVSAPNAEPNGLFGAGQVFGVLGPIREEADLFNLAQNNVPGLVISGIEATTFMGERLLCTDLNQDGVKDLLVSDPGTTHFGTGGGGAVLIFLGGPSLTGFKNSSDADIVLSGFAGGHLGSAFTTGDFDGDGRTDLAAMALGSRFLNLPSGVARISGTSLFNEDGSPKNSNPVLTIANSTLVGGSPTTLFGFALASADLNGDGFDELIISEPRHSVTKGTRNGAGKIYVLLGRPGPFTVVSPGNEPERFTIIEGFDADDEMGISIATGDLNGDGRPDLAMGAHRADGFDNARPDSGEVLVLFGGARFGLGQQIDLRDSPADFVFFGAKAGDALGKNVQIEDIDGNGRLDLLLAAPLEDNFNLPDSGILHLLFSVDLTTN